MPKPERKLLYTLTVHSRHGENIGQVKHLEIGIAEILERIIMTTTNNFASLHLEN